MGLSALALQSKAATKEVWESALNHRAADIETVSNYGDVNKSAETQNVFRVDF